MAQHHLQKQNLFGGLQDICSRSVMPTCNVRFLISYCGNKWKQKNKATPGFLLNFIKV